MSFRPLNMNFGNMPEAVLESEAKIIVASIVSNSNFPTPEPSIGDLNTAISEYSAAIAKAAGGDHTAVQVKKQKKKALANALNTLANYVQLQANGDTAILASANIKMKKEPAPRMLGAIESYSFTSDGAGRLLSKVKIKNGKTFIHEHTEDPLTENSVWKQSLCSSGKCIMEGLEGGKKYWGRITIIGTRDQQVTSAAVASYVI